MVMLKGLSASMNAKISGTGDEFIVLAHGYGGDQSFWEKVAPFLEEKHKVVVFDWNFSGAFNDKVQDNHTFDEIKYGSLDTFADDLVSLMDEMNIKSCVFVGHSMSGMIGCIASIKRPHLFKKLILIGASPRYLNSEDYEGGFDALQIEQLLSTIETNFYPWTTAFAPIAVGGDTLLAEKFEKSLKKMKPEVALAVAKIIFLGDYRHVLEKVDTPCTIISTTNDLVVPSSVPYYMQKKMIKAKSKVEIIDVDGHFPHLTAHNELLNVLSKVLDS
ncbi:strigolactone esterase RMS3 [Beta vulgaris subsp. vulgaris]|uniref:strigolactone esterase RMS3 n=1 Tax=Beta vulgaris subsp. vulgaris TaxID=3555 RepID=UPI0020371507|nr:strigolactone esterase RMS3 [Beta vulgaris subsp. vulgaris]